MTHELDQLRTVIERGVAALRQTIPEPAPGNPATASVARGVLQRVTDSWARAEDALAALTGRVATIRQDPRLTPEARSTDVRAAVQQVRDVVDDELGTIERELGRLADRLRRETLPARPQPEDAAQEAALANLKTDLRMVLDATPASGLVHELLELLAQYQAANNQLAVWLLAVSDWPALYLRSRGRDTVEWTARLPHVLAGLAGDAADKRLALALLDVVEGPRGMLGATVAMKALVRMRLDDILRPVAAG